MEGLYCLKTLLREGDFMTSIDLKDTYFSVAIHEASQRFLCFIWGSKHYAFLGLPFGLSTAPQVFTMLLKPVAAFLRKQGYRIIIYLDDFLLLASSREEALHLSQVTLTRLQSLGFQINWKKSTLTPTQKITYIGFLIDSWSMTFHLPDMKVRKVLAACESALCHPGMTAWHLASLLGTLESCRLAIRSAPLQ